MSTTIHLPEAMPEITSRTLLVVCDAHHCSVFDIAGHTLMLKEEIRSHEPRDEDRQSISHGKGGATIGVGEHTHVEEHRLHEFAHTVSARMATLVSAQKIEAVYLAAPGKFLSLLKKNLATSVAKLLEAAIDGNFAKEPPLQTFARFRPDLKAAMDELRGEENYSSKKHLPK